MTASPRVATITIGEFIANHWHGPCDLTVVRHATRRWRDGREDAGFRFVRAWKLSDGSHAMETWFEFPSDLEIPADSD